MTRFILTTMMTLMLALPIATSAISTNQQRTQQYVPLSSGIPLPISR